MTTSYNHFYDTYFKQKGSSGAISNGSLTYTLRCDGNTYLNGNVDTNTINSVSLTNLPNLPYLDVTSSINTQLSSKTTLSAVQSNANVWTSTNSFNTSLPTSTLTPSTSTQLITKAYADASYTPIGGTTLSAVQSNNNTWTGTNVFNTSLPTSTLTPTTSTQLITKNYGDSNYATQTQVSSLNSSLSSSIATKQNILSNASYLDVTSSAQTQINSKTTLSAVQSNANVWTSTNSFNTSLPTSTLTPSTSSQLVTKTYVDTQVATKQNTLSNASYLDVTSSAQTQINNLNTILTGASWDGTYYYLNLSNNLHVYGSLQLAGLSNDVSTTFSNIYSTLSTLTTLSAVQSNNNVWTGTNSFNTSLPTSTLTPSSSTQLITKAYADATYTAAGGTTLSAIQSNNNVWTGTNSFNTSLPTSTLTPSSSAQLITKAYGDSSYTPIGGTTLSAVQSNNNTWTGTNVFNTSLPTSTLTPSSSTQLTTKTYVDTQVATKQNILSNASYLDVTSSAQTQINTINTTLSGKQATITSSTNLTTGTISCTSLTCTSETDSGALSCNSLNVQKGAITSDGSSFWLSNNTNGYGVNFALYQGSSGNTVLNSSSGQDMEFKINNTMYMQMYSNGVLNIGANQVFNKQLALYDTNTSDTPSSATAFYGFGVNSHVLRYQVDTTSSGHKFYGGTTNYASIDNTGITTNNVTTSSCSLIPPGVIINSLVTISSSVGYLLCDGSAVSRTTYSALYTALGTVYGSGNGSTTFNLPDLRGAFLRGNGTNGSNSAYVGNSLGSYQSDAIAGHNHTITSASPNNNYLYGGNTATKGLASGGTAATVTSLSAYVWPSQTDYSSGAETRPFNYSVYYYIKW